MSGRPLNLQHSVTQQFHPHLTQKETEAWRGREGDSQDVVGVAELWVQPRRAYAPVGIPSACGCLAPDSHHSLGKRDLFQMQTNLNPNLKGQ